MTYSLLKGSRPREEHRSSADAAKIAAAAKVTDAEFLSTASGATPATGFTAVPPASRLGGELVSADNVPSYVLATSGLDNEQKLQVALCRRQAWVRAAQAAPTLSLWAYACCVLVDSSKLVGRISKNTKLAATLCGFFAGGSLGSFYGGMEGKPMMNAALAARKVEGAHTRRNERPRDQQEDAMVAFVREGTRARS